MKLGLVSCALLAAGVLACAATGCGGGAGSPSGGSGTGETGNDGADGSAPQGPDASTLEGPPATHFASSPASWAVPSLGREPGFWLMSTGIWATVDIDGDGLPDLVSTAGGGDPASSPVWGGDGAAYWKVHRNTGRGFDKAATSWHVPSIGTTLGVKSVGSTFWSLLDLNGDHRPDLVYTSDADGDPSNPNVWGGDGAAYWKVYLNTGNGFAATATSWPVPALGGAPGFWLASAIIWSTFDLDGDGLPDLVSTAGGGGDPAHPPVWGGDGAAYWKVYRNTGSGFARTAASWPVPSIGTSLGVKGAGSTFWATLDLDGDHRPELVYTSDANGDPSNPSVWGGDGAAYWKVYANTGRGFASNATKWSVPAMGRAPGFWMVSTSVWSTFDLDGDGLPELVSTADANANPSDPSVWGGDGAAYWKVYRHADGGFGASLRWPVPSIGAARGLWSASSTTWSTLDLDGDHRPDLVYTSDANGDPSNPTVWGGDGSAHWKVFAGTP